MLSHKEINQKFLVLDKNETLLNLHYKQWLAWSIVKYRLWALVRNSCLPTQSTKKNKFKQAFSVVRGFCSVISSLIGSQQPSVAYAYAPRLMQLDSRKIKHPVFQSLIDSSNDKVSFEIICGTEQFPQSDIFVKKNCLLEKPVSMFFTCIALIICRQRQFTSLAEVIAAEFVKTIPHLSFQETLHTCRLSLALFYIKTQYFSALFKRKRIKEFFVEDYNGKVSAVAAAKTLNIPVFEVQHGMFGLADIDYPWTQFHWQYKAVLPAPDRVYVYGQLWKNILLKNGFWLDEDIKSIEHLAINYYRRVMSEQSSSIPGKQIKILFATQSTVHDDSAVLIQELLLLQAAHGGQQFKIYIKQRPGESQLPPIYVDLQSKYPRECEILPPETDPYVSIINADIVIGFTSTMLIDALGLGRRVASFRGGIYSEGFCEISDVQSIKDYIPEFSTVDRLYNYLVQLNKDNVSNNAISSAENLGEFLFGNKTLNQEVASSMINHKEEIA